MTISDKPFVRGDRMVQLLAAELRRVKQTAGLSYADLESRTPYSRSSLERYINGKLFPTREAVGAIAEACHADPVRLNELWREEAAGPPSEAQRDKPARAPHRWPVVLAVSSALLALALVSLLGFAEPKTVAPAPVAVEPVAGEMSRYVSTRTKDEQAHAGLLTATVRWMGKGPYDGSISATIRQGGTGRGCAVALARYDGVVRVLGVACGSGAAAEISEPFQRVQHAVVQVCLRDDEGSVLRDCSDWS